MFPGDGHIPGQNLTAPLRQLLHKDVAWIWTQRQQDAFDRLKLCATSPPVLHFLLYDIERPVTLTCDTSQHGLGAACLQDGVPVAYSTKTRYVQIEKELQAFVFACYKF